MIITHEDDIDLKNLDLVRSEAYLEQKVLHEMMYTVIFTN